MKPPRKKYNPQQVEEGCLRFWAEDGTFEKSVESRRGGKPYIFLEGPPTANGMPGIHHVLARHFKDMGCRYHTMKGYMVERKGGWDTHGLPVEIEVEKELGLTHKGEIEDFGIAPFNAKCRENVFRYEAEWRRMTERMGFWIDMDDPYITLKNDYIESVWWSLKNCWDRGLLYRGHKIVPYCPRCGTPLSSHEVAQGYRDIEEPTIFIRFRVRGEEDLSILAWTTTPWTLLSNVALAVHPDLDYCIVRFRGERLLLAKDLLDTVLREDYEVLATLKGADLEGKRYEPLFDFIGPEEGKRSWMVVLADFVTIEEGTGVVHIAPAFGEDDSNVGRDYDLQMIQPVDRQGRFTSDVPPLEGMFVKDADPKITSMLRESGRLLYEMPYTHTYPFCWRCDSPLLYYAMESWFISMSSIQQEILANNERIRWFPSHLKHGRFGDFLDNIKDWALSRDRYWGTPLPIWTCSDEGCGHRLAIGGRDDIRALGREPPDDLHRPFIDGVTFDCPECGGEDTMRRERYLIDVWYDSGSAFFAQWHYPFDNGGRFGESFPVDYICEAIDQTRGWFYTLLAVATLSFDDTSFRECLCLGHILDAQGQKMSKSRGNSVDPWEIFGAEGADALRWYMSTVNAPWKPILFDRAGVREALSKFILTLFNTYSFYATYASLDGFDHAVHAMPPHRRPVLDRWLLSRLNSTLEGFDDLFASYEIHRAGRALESFVLDDLSNWYVRRSRKRFWGQGLGDDKRAGYSTLHEAILTVSKAVAPLMPFLPDEIYRNLGADEEGRSSVHLADYPLADASMVDLELEKAMSVVIAMAETGRRLRSVANIKNRQPLPRVILVGGGGRSPKLRALEELLRDELNVKAVEFREDMGDYSSYTLKPDRSKLGPKYKADAPLFVKALETALEEGDPAKLRERYLAGQLKLTLEDGREVSVEEGELTVHVVKSPDFLSGEAAGYGMVLDTRLTPELAAEGLEREIIRRIQEMRKGMDLHVEESVEVTLDLPEGDRELLEGLLEHLGAEVRAASVAFAPIGGEDGAGEPEDEEGSRAWLVRHWDLDGRKMGIRVSRA